MIYGPDERPIPRTPTPLEVWYSKRTLEMLQDKFRLSDLCGPRLYDARGNQIEWPGRPMVPVKTGRPIQFFRHRETEGQGKTEGENLEGIYNEGGPCVTPS